MYNNDTVITTVYNAYGIKMGTIYQDADGNMYYVEGKLGALNGYEDTDEYFD